MFFFPGYVNKLLSEPLLYPFSRVTYCAYLVHPLVIRLTAMNLDSPFHLGKDLVVSMCARVFNGRRDSPKREKRRDCGETLYFFSFQLITFLGQLVLSYALSFVISISFEAPVVSMLKILSPKKRKRIH